MDKVKDLVCGVDLDRDVSAGCYNLNGKDYCFCSEECWDKFSQNPGRYL